MLSGNTAPSLADIAAVTGDNNNGSWGNGWWILILLFAMFGGWGNGFFGNGMGNGQVVTTGDLQRGFDTQSLLNKIDGVTSQIDALGYDQLGRMDNIQNAITTGHFSIQNAIQNAALTNLQNTNAITSQLANYNFAVQQGQSDIRYNQAADTCSITNAINQAAQNIMQNDNANYRLLHDENVASEMNRLKELIADKDQQINALNLANSQAAQTQQIVNEVRPTPAPTYTVPNPWTGCSYGYGSGCCS